MKIETRLSLAYFVLATLWIILSDAVLAAVAIPSLVNTIQTYKGALFVIITSLLLFALLRWEFSRRRRSEQAAQEGKVNFRYLFINNPLPMWVYDLDTLRFLDVNEAAVDQYGYTRDEFLSMRITDIRPQEDVPRLLEHATRDRPTLQHSGVWRHRYKNGDIINVDITSHRLEFAGYDAALIVAQNVTDRIAAQNAMRESNAALQAVIMAAPLAILRISPQGIIEMCNPAVEQMFGWKISKLVGHLPPYTEADLADFLNILERTRKGETVLGRETQRFRADGKLIDISVSTAPIHGVSGEVKEIIAIIEDITERKRAEAELLEQERLRLALNKEIELRNLRARFMSMVSHEFRNPLAVIATSTGILERYYVRMSAESRQANFARIQTNIHYLTEMLDDILTLLHTESIGLDFKPVALDLVDLCSRLVSDMRLQVHDTHQIEWVARVEKALIQGDPKLLQHAVTNLLSNAVKYSPPQSTIHVEINAENHQVNICVKDQGIGIPRGELNRLFEPFYRAENVGSVPGNGLGLAIVHQAVELHSGQLQVESELGVGSIFTIHLPANGHPA